MALIRTRGWEQLARVFGSTGRRGSGQVNVRPMTDQRVDGIELAMPKRRHQGTIRVGSVVAQEIDEKELDAVLASYAAGTHEPQSRIDRTPIRPCARVEDP
jgi:hypothetical protein